MGQHMHWQKFYCELGRIRKNPTLCPVFVYQNYGRNIDGVDCRNECPNRGKNHSLGQGNRDYSRL